ncbi:centriole, cilia and spindle-associated protein isoform X1 [Pseudoliparis swirei]|uniref:centriole, cilia and spindle-associated protein isoform X1 n=2 Tax=Pseudoliparis swirei TaxID=2059687 RepID=UPI0024BE831C|nr:centriole, cilia and spindle-associated protein isoform X1 [Pseudoliparis swirei]
MCVKRRELLHESGACLQRRGLLVDGFQLKMVTKRMRSEYMKKFKDPKWETYAKCYEEMLKYRLTRRLLENAHNPWFWSGTDSDSDSGGRSPPPPSKNQVQPETCSGDGMEVQLEECEGARMDRQQQEQLSRAPESESGLPLPKEDAGSAVHGSSRPKGATEQTEAPEEREEQTRSQDRERDTGGARPQQSKAAKSSKQMWRSQRVRPAPAEPPRDDGKDRRHPFALYGSGEKEADMASRKTHNVGPAASTTEIHQSALRAKTRREVERQVQIQTTERRRATTANLDKDRTLVQPEFNPWITEYMRCFSARS